MPRAWPSPPTDNEVMLYRYRKGGVIAREIVASCAHARCSEDKVAKRGGGGGGEAYLRDTTVLINHQCELQSSQFYVASFKSLVEPGNKLNLSCNDASRQQNILYAFVTTEFTHHPSPYDKQYAWLSNC